LQTDPVGKKGFCQCAEFFINGFKLGHTALGLHPQKYIAQVKSNKPFEPLAHSVVLFPKSYQELYALDSAVAKCFQDCFSIEGGKVSEITVWDVSYKVEGV
jgi:hypothetical protein